MARTAKKSNPSAGYYVDEYFEYDVRHFVYPYNTRDNIDENIRIMVSDNWYVGWSSANPSAEFVLFKRSIKNL